MTDYRNRRPLDPYARPCPINYGPLDRALDRATWIMWTVFVVLAVPVPLVLWWWS